MPIIKLVFADDIRRFPLENEQATLETIETLVGSTFNLSPNEFSLNYVDTDNDKVSISTDEELEEALQQAQGLPLKINVQKLPGKALDGAALDFLRSSKAITNEANKPLQVSPPSTPKSKPVLEVPEPIKPAVNNNNNKPSLASMLATRETQDELTSLVFKTLKSPQFMDWAMNNDIFAGFFSVMAEVANEKPTPKVSFEPPVEKPVEKPIEKPVKSASEPLLEVNIIKPQFNASNSVSIEEDKQTSVQAEEKHVNEVEDQPAEDQGFVVVKKEPVIPGEEQPEQPEQPEHKEPGLVQSLLSIFKKKDNEDEIPNQEDLLKKLADMGFNDKEANLKALRFHKKYNEGLDEVVEDLLLQRTVAKQAEEKEKEKEKALQLAPIPPVIPEMNAKS